MIISNRTSAKIVYLISAAISFLLPISARAQFDPSRGIEGTNLSDRPAIDVLQSFLRYGLAAITILGVIGFLISGIIFIVAGGAGKAGAARNWLVFSIVGIVVALSGYIIIRLISNLLIGNVDVEGI